MNQNLHLEILLSGCDVSLETVLISIFIKLFCDAWERPKPLNNIAMKAGRGEIRIEAHFHRQFNPV